MADAFIGAVINGYEVLSLIGVGGMARVYLARQQSMNRQVALKVLPKQFVADDTYLQRFHREVKIVSQLEHAHIVPVYDYGEYDDQPFIVMRYMAGGSADDLLDRGGIDLEMLVDLISQIAPALDHAHAKGVLHRDLKPSNVLRDETGSAFLSDFGIARLNEAKGSTITTQGVVGTPSYMSPEQAQGKPMDGRSDLYSLGVMIFELATGRRPFEAETPYSIAVMQVTTPPPSPRSFNPSLPQSVERVILRALRKEPSERPARAAELAEDLRQALRDAAKNDTDPKLIRVEAPPPMTGYAPVAPSGQLPPSATPAPMFTQAPLYPPMPSASYVGPLLSPRSRRGSAWTGALLGGGIGCLFLIVLIGLGVVAVNAVLPSRTDPTSALTSATQDDLLVPPDPATSVRTPAPTTPTATLDATSEAARATLLARQAGSDATQTAAVFPSPASGQSGALLPTETVGNSLALTGALRPAVGSIVYADQRGEANTLQIMRLNLTTRIETQLTADNADNSYPVVSPDGRWIAFQSNRDGNYEIYVMNLMGGQLQRITSNDTTDRLPSWSPDSQWLLYSADVRGDGSYDLLRSRLDSSRTEIVLTSSERKSHARYSPDGLTIVFTTGSAANDARTWEIATLNTQSGSITPLTSNDTRDASPVYSPDGSQILYITATSPGDNALVMMNADGSNERVLLDDGSNNWAANFSPDGAYIVFTRTVGVVEQLYIMDANGENVQQLTQDGGNSGFWYNG